MADILFRMLGWATLGLALVLLLRKPARSAFGAGPAFLLWLLPVLLAVAPVLPRAIAPAPIVVLPGLNVTARASTGITNAGVDWAALLVAAWLAGVAICLVRLAWCYLRLRGGARHGAAPWLAAVRAVAPSLDLRRARVHAAGPAVLAALPRALLLLPDDFVQHFETAATRELVLRHELTHLRRGDAWWSLAMELASTLLWFHPLAWFARPRFRLDQELACDAASLREAPQRSARYARALLDSIAVAPTPALIPWLAEPQLKERIAMISRMPPGALRRRAGFLVVAAMLAGGLYLAGGQVPVRAAAPGTSARPPAVDITFKNRHPPQYPVAAVKQGEQGTVVLDVTIDAKGDVVGARVDATRTTAPVDLQQAALAAAVNWKFAPGMKNGRPVGGVVRIPVNFSLGGPTGATGGSCPAGFHYKQGKGQSYSCIHEQPKAAAAG